MLNQPLSNTTTTNSLRDYRPHRPLHQLKSTKAFNSDQLQALADLALVNLEINKPEPEPLIEIVQDGELFTLGSAGNFSLITGKAKSRKSYLVYMLMVAGLLKYNDSGKIFSYLPEGKNKVVLFDTEQGEFHVQNAVQKILAMAGPDSSDKFKAYSLRAHNYLERLEIIEHVLYNTPGIGVVAIDGIRDLVSSINDEEQASLLISKLLKWTKELNIHIVCVLHQNKDNNNARGHLGSEAVHKAETTLSITKESKNKNLSTVKVEYSRELEFSPFSFTINDKGLPIIVEGVESLETSLKTASKELPYEIAVEIVKSIFEEAPQFKYRKLYNEIKVTAEDFGYKLSDSKVRVLIQSLLEKSVIKQSGTPGTRHAYYELSLPDYSR